MHFHALASFQQGVNINSVHRPCHMLELPRGNPLHTFSDPVCYQPTLFELPTTATNQVLLIASFSYHQLLLTFPSGWCAYFLALLSIFANAGILEHQDSPNWTNLEVTQDYVLQAPMLWIFNRRYEFSTVAINAVKKCFVSFGWKIDCIESRIECFES